MTGLRFGLKTYDAAPWPELQQRWRDQEAAGFDALWAGDHVWSSRDDAGELDRPRFDAWLMAAGIASVTSRVTVGTLVSPITLRNPTLLAKQAVTVDHMSGGRVIAGIGAGGNPKDRAITGGAQWSSAETSNRLEEYARIARSVMDGGDIAEPGQHWSAHGVSAPQPIQPRPKLLVAAHTAASIRAAARHGDIWNSYGILFSQIRAGISLSREESVANTARRSRILDVECERIGRDPAEITRSFMLAFTADAPWTSVEEFRDTIGRYADIGITEFMFPFPLQGPHDMEVFAEVVADVIPRLQAGERP